MDEEQCAYEDCENEPIVGINDHFVCEEHLQWGFDTFAGGLKAELEARGGGITG